MTEVEVGTGVVAAGLGTEVGDISKGVDVIAAVLFDAVGAVGLGNGLQPHLSILSAIARQDLP